MQYISIPELYEHFLGAGQKICTDTRRIEKGAIFFALKGSQFNANEFAAEAIRQGCVLAVIDEERFMNGNQTVLVKDVLATLQELASYHRSRLKIPVLAITGSNGKTTSKELIHTVLSRKYNTLSTSGNLNNHIGVPLTVLSINSAHEFAVVEMGANHQGEIADLCRIADPDFGLITNVGKAHLEGFGGMEGVRKGKGELLAHLRARGGKTFVNGDDAVLNDMAFSNDKITYGCKKLYDIIGKDVTKSGTISFQFTTRYGEKNFSKLPVIETQIIGSYNFMNCLAAAAVGNHFKVEDQLIKEALEHYLPNMNRSQLIKTARNTIILDAYNANPNSMKAAIENFENYDSDKKVALLGDMFELGEFSDEEHRKLVELLKNSKIRDVVLVGDHFFGISDSPFRRFRTTGECREYLAQKKITGSTVLIKGSRGMKMEVLQDVL
jgi:UDP-N-acetylmuramoyl-tripeptide--D-alanyl-D-alanine ligase